MATHYTTRFQLQLSTMTDVNPSNLAQMLSLMPGSGSRPKASDFALIISSFSNNGPMCVSDAKKEGVSLAA